MSYSPCAASPTFSPNARTRHIALLDQLDQLDLTDVTVIGSSFGCWIAAEMALLDSPRLSGAVIVDGIGIEVDRHPMTQVVGLAPAELAKLSFH